MYKRQARYRVTWQPPRPLRGSTFESNLIVDDALLGIDAALAGNFHEPKRSAFALARECLSERTTDDWEALVQLDADSDPIDVERALAALLSP